MAGGGTHQRLPPHGDIHQGQKGSQSLIEGQQDSEPGPQSLRGPHVLQEVGVPALAHTREAAQNLTGSVQIVTGHTGNQLSGGQTCHALGGRGRGLQSKLRGVHTRHVALVVDQTHQGLPVHSARIAGDKDQDRSTTAGTCKDNTLAASPCHPTRKHTRRQQLFLIHRSHSISFTRAQGIP